MGFFLHLIPLHSPASLAGCAAGVEFLLLHLPPITSENGVYFYPSTQFPKTRRLED